MLKKEKKGKCETIKMMPLFLSLKQNKRWEADNKKENMKWENVSEQVNYKEKQSFLSIISIIDAKRQWRISWTKVEKHFHTNKSALIDLDGSFVALWRVANLI